MEVRCSRGIVQSASCQDLPLLFAKVGCRHNGSSSHAGVDLLSSCMLVVAINLCCRKSVICDTNKPAGKPQAIDWLHAQGKSALALLHELCLTTLSAAEARWKRVFIRLWRHFWKRPQRSELTVRRRRATWFRRRTDTTVTYNAESRLQECVGRLS